MLELSIDVIIFLVYFTSILILIILTTFEIIDIVKRKKEFKAYRKQKNKHRV